MQIALLGDIHYGLKNGDVFFLNKLNTFFKEQFFPYLKEHNINTVIQFGDTLDSRKYIHVKTLQAVKEFYFKEFKKNDINLLTILGNHDIFNSNNTELSLLYEIAEDIPNVELITKYTTKTFGTKTFDFVPWMNKENNKEYLSKIKSSASDYCLGHFEINGMEMTKGVSCSSKLTQNMFKDFLRVLSGHFHVAHGKKHIQYMANPIQLDWSDFSERKGFWILDTEENSLDLIENKDRFYHKIYYNDIENNYDKIKKEFKNLTGYVKLFVKERTNELMYDRFIYYLQTKNDLKDLAITTLQNINIEDDDIESFATKDNLEIMFNVIDESNTSLDKISLKTKIKNIYNESVAL